MMTRTLPCRLTIEEWNAAAEALAESGYELAALDVEKKLAMASFKERAEKIEATQRELAAKVKTRSVPRPVEVFERSLPTRLVVEIYRADTGELVDTRPMTATERDDVVNPRLPGTVVTLDRSARERVEAVLEDEKPKA